MNNQLTPIQKTQQLISTRKPELAKMLPKHIDIETLERAANNALMRNPDIASCDPTSVYDSVMRCAQDGLIPDGKEAAIVVYGGKGGKKAQYQPMIDGVLKRLRQSGLIENIAAKAVFEGDDFDYWFDEDGEHVKYRPDFNAVPPVSILQPIDTYLVHFLNKRVPKLQARDSGIWYENE